ncbi:FkbM family methyltransferase [Phormidium tenue]|uniref:Methyltransferase FkbM domain-containing protein n=1 Tax=Phormidium tenue NIES-30 TaxID=549789 RepID=A0A1U7JBK5_9CYAN|nr:FkbM family methyltransferase [Phormidium tenue]MBD2230081.1 FkbM family methyltransferase [Phormidium tenue FACHB-1052]OKH51080.1 hypothetical protein NIES30_03155 [Phormidium tenue NIES-30]
MLVEDCCQALLAQILPTVGYSKSDYAIEIGCGTFAFYCELFDKLNFPTIAVEPLPAKNLKKLCRRRNIPLVEACITEKNGTVNLYVGNYLGNENLNLSSTCPDWWGSTATAKEVASITLKDLISMFSIERIGCLKIDIEGAEYSVLNQLSSLNPKLLPKVIMFEYGGGGTFESKQGGWAKGFLQDTMNILSLLNNLGYGQLIQIDSEKESKEKVFNLETINLVASTLFSSKNVYGNMIAIHDNKSFPKDRIESICNSFRGDHPETPPLKISEPLSKRIAVEFRRLVYR